MGSKKTLQKDDEIDQQTRTIIKRIAYEHGMSYDEALTYYLRNK